MNPLSLEALEARDLLSVTSVLRGSILSLTGSPDSSHTILIRPTPGVAAPANSGQSGSVDILTDGASTTYLNLTQVNYTGGVKGDTVTDRTPNLGGLVKLGDGNNVVYSSTAVVLVTAGDGNNIIQNTGTFSSTTVGNGNNNVYGGVANSIVVGSGVNVVYDILPSPAIATTISVASHQGVDHLFTGPNTILQGALPQDHVAQFFVTGRAPGSGTLVQVGNTLYFTANNNGDRFLAFDVGPQLVVSYDLNDGTGPHIQAFAKSQVNQLAVFGGNGNDLFVNNSTTDDVMYGAGGSNTLIGGFGQLDLEKAGGAAATGSLAIGRSPVMNDLNGSGLTNTQNTLIFQAPASAVNIARTNSPQDVITGLKVSDFLVSLYPDQVIGAFLPPYVPA